MCNSVIISRLKELLEKDATDYAGLVYILKDGIQEIIDEFEGKE